MSSFRVVPEIVSYDTIDEFVTALDINEDDVIVTNEYIYAPLLAQKNLSCKIIFQERYGLGEPTDEMVEAMYRDMPSDYRRVIAIGGGTVIDISKLFALKTVSPVLDLYDGKIPAIKDKELVLVPTTCGTGSEVTNISILALISRNTKKGLACEAMYADKAVLIPEFLKSLPLRFFATSSIDALIHAIESSLSPKANDYTKMFGYKAIAMILSGYMDMYKNGPDARLPRLKDFLTASNYAGIAFGNAGCAAVHALSYPLGASYHVAHGEANYAIFLGVMKKYMEKAPEGELLVLNKYMAGILGCAEADLYTELEKLLSSLIPLKALHEYGMKPEEIEGFTDSVIENQQRLLKNNFTALDRDDIMDIYRALY